MEDTVYYRCELEGGIIYLFSEYHNFSKNGYVFGKPIYIKKKNYGFDASRFKTKVLPEGEFLNLAYVKNGENFQNVSDYEMRDIAKREFLEVETRSGVFDNYVFINENLVTKTYFPREVLKTLREKDLELNSVATEIEKFFNLEKDQLGITGSILIGANTFGDYDFVFYGNNQKLLEIKRKIDSLTAKKECKVFENGLFWKARFYLLGKLICCFFNYENYLPCLREIEKFNLEKKFKFTGIVVSDEFSLSKNAYFKLKESKFDSVILLSNMFKNAINVGDEIVGECYEAVLKSGERLAVVKNPQENLKNFLQFFKA